VPSLPEAGSHELIPPGLACFNIDRHEAKPIRNTETKLDQTPVLPRRYPWLADLEYLEA